MRFLIAPLALLLFAVTAPTVQAQATSGTPSPPSVRPQHWQPQQVQSNDRYFRESQKTYRPRVQTPRRHSPQHYGGGVSAPERRVRHLIRVNRSPRSQVHTPQFYNQRGAAPSSIPKPRNNTPRYWKGP